jgi:hypothetical protein
VTTTVNVCGVIVPETGVQSIRLLELSSRKGVSEGVVS